MSLWYLLLVVWSLQSRPRMTCASMFGGNGGALSGVTAASLLTLLLWRQPLPVRGTGHSSCLSLSSLPVHGITGMSQSHPPTGTREPPIFLILHSLFPTVPGCSLCSYVQHCVSLHGTVSSSPRCE